MRSATFERYKIGVSKKHDKIWHTSRLAFHKIKIYAAKDAAQESFHELLLSEHMAELRRINNEESDK